ncbi:Uncharacterised protein [Bordetella pertussis]|nr:Uncharacterised protein [Bordetella pertussis]
MATPTPMRRPSASPRAWRVRTPSMSIISSALRRLAG